MNHNDAYGVLGISPDASEKEIKAAYKRMAKKYHPDLNSGDSTAEQKFKEVGQAYAILTGKEKGQSDMGADPFTGFGFNHPFFNESIFDQIFRRSRMVNQIRVDPELFINGGQFPFQFQINDDRGRASIKQVMIQVEPDTPVGVQIAVPGTQPNHIFLQLLPGDTSRYRVTDGVNLTESQSISAFKAMCGGEHEVIIPNGKTVLIKIPAGTQAGAVHRIRGSGLKMPDGTYGDYNVQFTIIIPSMRGTEEEIKQQVLDHLSKEFYNKGLDV